MPDCADGLSERRDTKNDVAMISNCQPSFRAITSAFGTLGDSIKPKRSRTVENLSLIVSILTRSAGSTRGVCAVSMVRITLCSCSTLLCLRLCNSAVGTKLGSLVRKTAVPLTTWGGRFSRLLIRSVSGTSMRRVFAVRIAAPRRQVQISIATTTPNSNGTQAPSNSFRRLALKKVMSTTTNGTISAAAVAARQFHNFQITTKPMMPSATMVVETAMP